MNILKEQMSLSDFFKTLGFCVSAVFFIVAVMLTVKLAFSFRLLIFIVLGSLPLLFVSKEIKIKYIIFGSFLAGAYGLITYFFDVFNEDVSFSNLDLFVSLPAFLILTGHGIWWIHSQTEKAVKKKN